MTAPESPRAAMILGNGASVAIPSGRSDDEVRSALLGVPRPEGVRRVSLCGSFGEERQLPFEGHVRSPSGS